MPDFGRRHRRSVRKRYASTVVARLKKNQYANVLDCLFARVSLVAWDLFITAWGFIPHWGFYPCGITPLSQFRFCQVCREITVSGALHKRRNVVDATMFEGIIKPDRMA